MYCPLMSCCDGGVLGSATTFFGSEANISCHGNGSAPRIGDAEPIGKSEKQYCHAAQPF